MQQFAQLFAALDQTTSTNAKVEAMAQYFAAADPADAAWAVFFLTGRRLKRLVPYPALRAWILTASGLAAWLFDECQAVVGDAAETAALVCDQLPHTPAAPLALADWMISRIVPLRESPPEAQRARVLGWVGELDRWQRFILFKLLTGELRLGVSHTLVVRALARTAKLPVPVMAARLMGDWTPSAEWFASLLASRQTDVDLSRPYPFCLASPLDGSGTKGVEGGRRKGLETLGDLRQWQVEWKWDGIRAQIVKREGAVSLWSRGEELVTTRFPEIAAAAAMLPDGTVLDGEILAWSGEGPLPFTALQQRIGRHLRVARKARDVPVVFLAYDVLEHKGVDIRAAPLAARRATLEALLGNLPQPPRSTPAGPALLPFEESAPAAALRLSPLLTASSPDALAALHRDARNRGVEGLMLKRLASSYGVGRKRGDWWKWKVEPFTIDAVLIYAQPGSGKRASLLTDYTFGVWHEGELVPVAKAYSGLTNEEIAELDRWLRRHTVERFGPVRHVEPVQVFELGFEAIARSPRHRSGVALRFPRMLRWRKDKRAADADTLDTVTRMIR